MGTWNSWEAPPLCTGSALACIRFRTDCNVPLLVGNQFGNVRLVNFRNSYGRTGFDCLLPFGQPCDVCGNPLSKFIASMTFSVQADYQTIHGQVRSLDNTIRGTPFGALISSSDAFQVRIYALSGNRYIG